jgi:gluconokinase
MAESTTDTSNPPPVAIIVMGTSGCGKSLIGSLLSQHIHSSIFEDADDYHSIEAKCKMANSIALTDADRQPWYAILRSRIEAVCALGVTYVLACSALKRLYRQWLIGDGRVVVVFVYLQGDMHLIGSRMAARSGHYMPLSLLQSQFDALEEPSPDEHAIVIDINHSPDAIVHQIIMALHQRHLVRS